MSQSDELQLFSAEASEASNSQPECVAEDEDMDKGKSLAKRAAADEALWTDAHTSDEEEYDPAKPDDLATATAKADAEGESDDDEGESNDSIVNDEPEEPCANHEKCILGAKLLDEFLLNNKFSAKSGGKERRSALVEVLCDHYTAL